MTQHDTHGNMMFMHTNLSPKWSLQLPGSFDMYSRRWQVLPMYCILEYGDVLHT